LKGTRRLQCRRTPFHEEEDVLIDKTAWMRVSSNIMDEYKVEVDGNEFKTIVQFNSGGGSFVVRVFGSWNNFRDIKALAAKQCGSVILCD
jgi:hypothetical protein